MNQFIELVKEAGSNFNPESEVCIIAHHDTDGICSAAILEKAFERKNISYNTINVQQIDPIFISNISEQHSNFIFADIGSSTMDLINVLEDKNIVVLDHHRPNVENKPNIIHLNPHIYGLDEEKLISGSGVTYFFAQGMDRENKDSAFLAVLGAIGDTQENNGFKELNNIILQHALIQKQVSTKKELRLYGKNSRPLVKILEYSSDINIPGITNNYKGALAFLRNLRIPTHWNNKPRKWFNLKEYEKDLITEEILNLKSEVNPEEITVNTYIFNKFQKRELKIARECATIINSCGRLEDFRTAIDALKGNEEAQEKAVMNLRIYKSEIRTALELFNKYKEENKLILSNKLVIFDAEDKINSNLIGVICSIIARNRHYDPNIIICGIAYNTEETVKISLRASHDKTDWDLSEVLEKIISQLGGTSGGHPNAAGAVIPNDKKEEFIQKLLDE